MVTNTLHTYSSAAYWSACIGFIFINTDKIGREITDLKIKSINIVDLQKKMKGYILSYCLADGGENLHHSGGKIGGKGIVIYIHYNSVQQSTVKYKY